MGFRCDVEIQHRTQIPNEEKPDPLIKKLLIVYFLFFLASATRKKKEFPEEKLIKKRGPRSPVERETSNTSFEKLFETPIEIKMITIAPFFDVFKPKKVKLFSIFF